MSKDGLGTEREKLRQQVDKDIERMQRADEERRTVLAQSAYIGIIGLLFVRPVIGGAYLGRWLDGMVEGYSMRWTLSLLFVGVVIGAANVYFFIRE